jgi:hypothetical protein
MSRTGAIASGLIYDGGHLFPHEDGVYISFNEGNACPLRLFANDATRLMR